MGADQNFFRNLKLWTSYLEAEDTGRSAEEKRVETQNWTAETGQTGCTDRSDRSLPDSPPTKLQMSNLEQTKSKSNETWRKASHLPHEHIPKRSFPED